MANAHDYFEYLTDHVDISPANSQEELNAATTIAELMGEHGIEVKTEEFDTASLGRLPYALLLVIIFIGTFIAGIGGLPLAFIGGLLAIGSVAVIILDHLGNNIFENFGPVARSQNVVAMHEASGPLVAKGNRPVVVVAHYDSPRESFLYSSGIAKYLPMLRRYTTLCVVIAGVSSFIQTLAFLPEALRRVFWVLGFLAAIPPLIVGIGAIVERFSSCSLGANDNKSSVAALLGVLEAVFPSDSAESLVARLAQKREAAELAARPVRHGEEVLRTLGVLPESCEIEYIDEPEPVEEEPEVEEEPAQATADLGTAEEPEAAEPAAAPAAKPSFRVVGDELPDPGATQLYRPQVADVARRAALFDLPDPSEEANDPFAPAAAPTSMADRLGHADRQNARRISDHLGTFDDEPDGLDVPAPSYDEPAPAEDKPKRFSLFDRKKREEEYAVDDDSTWDDLESQDSASTRGRKNSPRWKGGAAVSEELRESDADAPSDDELVEAAESLAIDELLCHDIWFVALGANGLDHAGMKAFIAKHRPQLRGAFVVNLDCVGAGTLSVLSSEGIGNTRRADRRINRLLKGAAADLHVDLVETPFDWSSTDATPAMRASMRAATIMGVNELGLPALSRTPDDVPENVDPAQASLVASLVTELIRRA